VNETPTHGFDRWRAIARRFDTPLANRIAKVVRWLFLAAVVAYLLLRLHQIGWREVVAALPATPWFYLIFLANFLLLPSSELLIYRLLWGVPLWRHLGVFVRKRVYNSAVVGYSGEVYMFMWARERFGLAEKYVLLSIKDSTILSSLASAFVTVLLLAAFVASGQTGVIDRTISPEAGWIGALLLGALFVVPLLVRFRRRIITAPGRRAAAVFAIHLARVFGVVGLQALQWSVVLPQVPLQVWIIFLTTQMVISRLPLLPNRDLLFLGVGLELAHAVNAPEASLAALFVAAGALGQGVNLLAFLVTSFTTKRAAPAAG
jgi:hypothetical protein